MLFNKDFISHWKNVAAISFQNFEVVRFHSYTPGIEILEWRNKNGSCANRIRFLFDEEEKTMTVSGDLGFAIFQFTEPATFDRISRYSSLDYFVEKMKISTDKYYYIPDKDLFLKELEECSGIMSYMDEDNEEEIKDLLEDLWEAYAGGDGIHLYPSLYDDLTNFCDDIYEWIGDIGRRIHPRVILWFEALHMVRKKLKEETK